MALHGLVAIQLGFETRIRSAKPYGVFLIGCFLDIKVELSIIHALIESLKQLNLRHRPNNLQLDKIYMLTNRTNLSEEKFHVVAAKGCPQGGVLRPPPHVVTCC